MLKKILGLLLALVLLLVAAAGWFIVAAMQANAGIEQEWQTTRVDKLQDLGTTSALEILPLFEEAAARNDLEPEHGVSYLVRTDHRNILLDVGMTPARFSDNAGALGIGANDFDTLFITHVHPDHIGGTEAWQANTFIPGDPPLDLQGKWVYVPLALSRAGVAPVVASQPQKLADGVASMGAIAFPELFPLSLKSMRNAEQTLAVNVEGKGIVLIMGCGHPTVERIVARAEALFDEPVVGIVGGLHYEGMTSAQAQPHIEFLKKRAPQLVAISPHDSSAEAIQAFREAFPGVYQELAVGRVITFPQTGAPLSLDSTGLGGVQE